MPCVFDPQNPSNFLPDPTDDPNDRLRERDHRIGDLRTGAAAGVGVARIRCAPWTWGAL